jgi:hypothetical protein
MTCLFSGHRNFHVGSESGTVKKSIVQYSGPADPDPYDRFTDPEHWVGTILPSKEWRK